MNKHLITTLCLAFVLALTTPGVSAQDAAKPNMGCHQQMVSIVYSYVNTSDKLVISSAVACVKPSTYRTAAGLGQLMNDLANGIPMKREPGVVPIIINIIPLDS